MLNKFGLKYFLGNLMLFCKENKIKTIGEYLIIKNK